MKFNIWNLVMNAGKITAFVKAVEVAVNQVVKNPNHMPNESAVTALFDGVELLLESGLIDIPGVDENALVTTLEEFKNQLFKKAGV